MNLMDHLSRVENVCDFFGVSLVVQVHLGISFRDQHCFPGVDRRLSLAP